MLKTTEVARLVKISQTALLSSLIALGTIATDSALAKKAAPKKTAGSDFETAKKVEGQWKLPRTFSTVTLWVPTPYAE